MTESKPSDIVHTCTTYNLLENENAILKAALAAHPKQKDAAAALGITSTALSRLIKLRFPAEFADKQRKRMQRWA